MAHNYYYYFVFFSFYHTEEGQLALRVSDEEVGIISPFSLLLNEARATGNFS